MGSDIVTVLAPNSAPDTSMKERMNFAFGISELGEVMFPVIYT